MATSRTGTAKWKNIRAQVLNEAQHNGLTRCPLCRVTLNYETSKLPSSAEVDHIVPHAKGGADSTENARVICRLCNQRRGGYDRKRAKQRAHRRGFVNVESSGDW